MYYPKIVFSIILSGIAFLPVQNIKAQNLDINLLESINPQHPNSFIWKTASSTTYPIAFGLPVGIWISGAVNHNKKTEQQAYEIMASALIAGIGAQSMKIVFNRPRPFEKYNTVYPYKIETDNSFPSGHTSVAFATATSVAIIYKKWYIVVPAYAWASGVGYSRLYLGEHYPSDVLAGAAVGAGSAIISHWISKKIFK